MKHMMLKASCGTLFLLCSQAALAHHATPTAKMVCDRDTGDWNIEYTATTWENCDILGFGGVESCGNPDIGIFFYDNESDATSLIEPTAGTPAAGATLALSRLDRLARHARCTVGLACRVS